MEDVDPRGNGSPVAPRGASPAVGKRGVTLGRLRGAAGVLGDAAIYRPSTIRAQMNRKVRARNELGLFQRWRLAHLEQGARNSLRQYKTVYGIHRQLSDVGISTDSLPAHPASTQGTQLARYWPWPRPTQSSARNRRELMRPRLVWILENWTWGSNQEGPCLSALKALHARPCRSSPATHRLDRQRQHLFGRDGADFDRWSKRLVRAFGTENIVRTIEDLHELKRVLDADPSNED